MLLVRRRAAGAGQALKFRGNILQHRPSGYAQGRLIEVGQHAIAFQLGVLLLGLAKSSHLERLTELPARRLVIALPIRAPHPRSRSGAAKHHCGARLGARPAAAVQPDSAPGPVGTQSVVTPRGWNVLRHH